MQVLDYRHSEPTPSPPHNSSWLLDNHHPQSSGPHSSPSPPSHSEPLAPSNSLTGISSHHPPSSSTPLRTSSSSTAHPSSHPSRANSEIYPSQHPSAPRDSPLPHHARLAGLNQPDSFNLNNELSNDKKSNSINTHSTLTKFGNLLNVSNAALEYGRNPTRMGLSISGSKHTEADRNISPNSYANPAHTFSPPIEYRSINPSYFERPNLYHTDNAPRDSSDPYQPMHRPHFPSQTYSNANGEQKKDHQTSKYDSNYHLDYSAQASNAYHNNSSPPYPGAAPTPVYKERSYGIPKFNSAFGSQTDTICHTGVCSLPSFKPMPNETEQVLKPVRARLQSPPIPNGLQSSKCPEVRDFALGGTLLRDTIQTFQAKGMNQERTEFLRDFTDLMKAYEEKCDIVYDATEEACMELMLKSRVPLVEDTITAPVDDETPEDASQKLVVKKKFVEAMEALQGDQLPTKRRGNLPKECTEYLKKWFDDHYDHPYPTDEEKLEMSKRTKIGMSQISHWFINYRKRVWKPSLPADHPAVSGENTKKPRKKQKTGNDDDVGN